MSIVILASGSAALPSASVAGSPELVDIAAPAGLRFAGQLSWAASTVDYNNDGFQDIWVGFHQQIDSKLMRNNGNGTFTYVAQNAWKRVNSQGGILDRHDCAWSDVDHNGLMDSYCSGGRNLNNYVKTAEKDNELWLQEAPGQFTDVGTEWGVGDPCGRGRYVAFLDVNGDSWDDLYLGNQSPRVVAGDPCDDVANGLPNEESKIFINTQGTGFTYAPTWNVNRPGVVSSCALPLDYNKDGRMDLLACAGLMTKTPVLYRNTGTGFASATALNLTPIADAVWEDVTGDGLNDLVMSDALGFFYRPGTATGIATAGVRLPYTPVGGAIGRSVAVGDINGDGRGDVYGLVGKNPSGNPDDVLFLNNGGVTPTFTALTPPSAGGTADSVTALKLTPTGNTTFFIQNGRDLTPGPTQLIQYVPPAR
ncbi:MAG: FG-GAP repeat domain-containing protein [Nocardioides sp.]